MDYYGVGRTNYFKVKGIEAFKKWVTSIGGAQFITKTVRKKGRKGVEFVEVPDLVGIIFDGGLPSMRSNPADEGDELIEFDFYEELKSHLKKGQVAVYTESGAEGHRYMTGYAVAMCPGKEDVAVNIDDIYALAAKKFKVATHKITGAAY